MKLRLLRRTIRKGALPFRSTPLFLRLRLTSVRFLDAGRKLDPWKVALFPTAESFPQLDPCASWRDSPHAAFYRRA